MNHVPSVALLFHGRSRHCSIATVVWILTVDAFALPYGGLPSAPMMIPGATLNLWERDYITIQSAARLQARRQICVKMFAMSASRPFEHAARSFLFLPSPFSLLSLLLRSMPMEGRYAGTNCEFTGADTMRRAEF